MPVLVGGRLFHGLGDDADVLRRIVADPGEVEGLEDVQHLDQHHAAAGRMVGGDVVVTVAAAQRVGPRRAVGREVVFRQQAAAAAHVLGDAGRGLAGVEVLRAVPCDPPQGVGEARKVDPVPDPAQAAVAVEVGPGPGGREPQAFLDLHPAVVGAVRPPVPDVRADREP